MPTQTHTSHNFAPNTSDCMTTCCLHHTPWPCPWGRSRCPKPSAESSASSRTFCHPPSAIRRPPSQGRTRSCPRNTPDIQKLKPSRTVSFYMFSQHFMSGSNRRESDEERDRPLTEPPCSSRPSRMSPSSPTSSSAGDSEHEKEGRGEEQEVQEKVQSRRRSNRLIIVQLLV